MSTTTDHVFIPESDLSGDRRHDVSAIFGEAPGMALISSRAVSLEARDSWSRGRTATIHHDPIRRGYFVVREGTRYIAVKGVVAGQWCACVMQEFAADAAASMNRGEARAASAKVENWPDEWCVIDLRNLGHADPRPKPEPRFQVKRSEEMRDGEPCLDIGGRHHTGPFNAKAARLNAGEARPTGERYSWRQTVAKTYEGAIAIIDTHAPEWQEFQRAHAGKAAPVAPPPERTGPTDEEIVRAWEAVWRWNETDGRTVPFASPVPHSAHWDTDGKLARVEIVRPGGTAHSTTRKDHAKARSAVLSRRIAESEERERRVVLGPIDDVELA